MVKRILKIVGIVLAGFVVIAGGAIGITALTGGFNEKVVEISKIYFDDNSTEATIHTLDDVTTKINFEPFDATEKDITVSIEGQSATGVNQIIDYPKTVTAGKDFTLSVKKDARGNNIGGVVVLKFQDVNKYGKPGINTLYLNVIVDTVIPDNSIYMTGSSSGKLGSTGKTFTMPVSTTTEYIELRSTLVNAFKLEIGKNEKVNLKSVDVSYKYFDKDGYLLDRNCVPVKNSQGQKVKDGAPIVLRDELIVSTDTTPNPTNGKYYTYFKIPIVTKEEGTIEISAKMHRTSIIHEEFNRTGNEFGSLVSYIKSHDISSINDKLVNFNNFLNKYIEYFDTTQESYNHFKQFLGSDGQIAFTYNEQLVSNIEKTLDFIYVTCKATVNVTGIKLDSFTSDSTIHEFEVFTEKEYSLNSNSIVDTFKLELTGTNKEGQSVILKDADELLKNSLTVKPYLYLALDSNSSNGISNDDLSVDEFGTTIITWSNRSYRVIPVYGFETGNDSEKPIITPIENDEMGGAIGYLLELTEEDEYFSIQENTNKKAWTLKCKAPMLSEGDRKLFIGFSVAGLDENGKSKEVETFTPINIYYESYTNGSDSATLQMDFKGAHLTINDNLTINDDLSGLELPGLEQTLGVTKTWDNEPTYTKIMYFAEEQSNKIEGSEAKKIATIGKYTFVGIDNVDSAGVSAYDKIVGERIPTFKTNNNNYYIQPLNASENPVKIFAVVYLCDKDGNPIDINGRRIALNIDEQQMDPVELVVIEISDISLEDSENRNTNVYISSYVNNINFYTKSLINSIQIDEELTYNTGEFIKRNQIAGAQEGEYTREQVSAINDFLKIKLLKENKFVLYVTPFELGESGEVGTESVNEYSKVVKGINGSSISMNYTIDVKNNKQYAFKYLCDNLGAFELVFNGVSGVEVVKVSNGGVETNAIVETEDGKPEGNPYRIRFILKATETGSAQGTIKFQKKSQDSSTIVSNYMTGEYEGQSNHVVYVVNELTVDNVELDGYNSYTRLHARYSDDTSKPLQFVEETYNEGMGMTTSPYFLELDKDGVIKYTMTSNVKVVSSESAETCTYNLSVVDCSQAGDREDDYKKYGLSSKTHFYSNIEDYISANAEGANASKITYSNASGVMTFTEDVTFTNLDNNGNYGNHLYFGTKAFVFDNNATNPFVNINGTNIKLNKNGDECSFVIKAGEYFPTIKDNSLVLIYGEEFQISNVPGSTIEEKCTIEAVINVVANPTKVKANGKIGLDLLLSTGGNPKAYDAENYFNKENSETSIIEIQKNSSNPEDNKKASVNFQYGEELGQKVGELVKPIFVEDNNGRYFKDTNGEYKQADNSFTGTRYSKKGVIVHLLITMSFGPNDNGTYKKTFYKVLTYEIIQEEFGFVGYKDGTTINGNSEGAKLEVFAGSETEISLGGGQQQRIIVDGAYNNNIFTHVTIGIDSASSTSGAKVERVGDDIVLTTPHLISAGSVTIVLTYPWKDGDREFRYYVDVAPDVSFAPKDGVWEITENTGNFYIFDGTNSSLINYYFNVDSKITNVELKISSDTSSYGTINGNTLTLYKSYGIKTGTGIIKDYIDCVITLTVGDDDAKNKIEVPNKLRIYIRPQYIIEYPSSVTIFNGENLFGQYIKLYACGQDGALSDVNLSDYSDHITLETNAEGVTINNGKVTLKNIPNVDTEISLNMKYKEGNEKEVTQTITVVIRGVKFKYYANGEGDGVLINHADTEQIIEVPQGKLAYYFDISLTTVSSDQDSPNIAVGLVDSQGNVVADTNATVGEQYGLCYYCFDKDSNPVLIEIVENYTITITQKVNQ